MRLVLGANGMVMGESTNGEGAVHRERVENVSSYNYSVDAESGIARLQMEVILPVLRFGVQLPARDDPVNSMATMFSGVVGFSGIQGTPPQGAMLVDVQGEPDPSKDEEPKAEENVPDRWGEL